MTPQNSDLCRVWILRISLITTFAVVVLSWINGLKLLDLAVRAMVSFGVMFVLMTGILNLFEKTARPSSLNEETSSSDGRGGLVDFTVGDDEVQAPKELDPNFPGQVDPSLIEGMPDGERQAEIVRRMGWD